MYCRHFLVVLCLLPSLLQAKSNTSCYFEQTLPDPQRLAAFLRAMPKGGELHNHLDGASFAENLLLYASDDGLCMLPDKASVLPRPYCPPAFQLQQALATNPAIFAELVKSWSIYEPFRKGSHNDTKFYGIFTKTAALVAHHSGEIIAEVKRQAAANQVSYIELIVITNLAAVNQLAADTNWQGDFDKLRQQLLQQHKLQHIIANIRSTLDAQEQQATNRLHCNGKDAEPGCRVSIRYRYAAIRNLDQPTVFTELLTGAELAKQDPRFNAIDLVSQEYGHKALHEYQQHMQMVAYFKHIYPTLKVSLHAGELSPDLVPATALRNHIRQAVQIAKADRIGHGTDILQEDLHEQTLQHMAKHQLAVEVNLSSNARLTGIAGHNHPLRTYLNYHVPVVLSTDDPGIMHLDLTDEYLLAVRSHQLNYAELKQIARNSIEYSFLPGNGIWQRDKLVKVCRKDQVGHALSVKCRAYLAANEKAALAWQLEQQFANFERDRQAEC